MKLNISLEEWDSCFLSSFFEVLDFVKYVWNVEMVNLNKKKSDAFFVNVLLRNISSWNCYHQHDIYNWLKCSALVFLASSWNIFYTLNIALPYVSFPHEKACRLSCKCHVCGKSFKRKPYIRKHVQKKHLIFFCSKFKTLTF